MDSIFIDKNLFAINMKRFRENLNLSQAAVAKELDIPRTSIINYEKGKYFPEITTLLNICSLYKCSLGELLSIDDSSFMNIPQFYSRIDNDKVMVNKFKEQLSTLTELNLKNMKLNNEIKAEKNKLLIKMKRLDNSKKYYDKSLEELNDSKNRYNKLFEELSNSQKRCNKLIAELTEAKKKYSKLINNLTFIQDSYLKSSSDIDDTRTYFLNSFSNVLENANDLLNRIENDSNLSSSKNEIIELNKSNNLDEEVANELVPEIDLNNSSYTYIDDEDDYDYEDEETVDVDFLDANIAAGKPISCGDTYNETKTLKVRYPLTKENADDFYILTLRGNSMNKIVSDGEDILIRATNYVENGTIAAVTIIYVGESECTLKYYYYDPETNLITLKPKSYDPSYEDLIFDANEQNVIVQGEYIGPVSDFL